MSSEIWPLGVELAATLATGKNVAALKINSVGKGAVAADEYAGADGVTVGHETRAGYMASLQTAGRVVRAIAGEALTAGTDRHLQVGTDGRLYKLTAGARIFANWLTRIDSTGSVETPAAGDEIYVALVPDVPRSWAGTATIDLGDTTTTVNVDSAFDGAVVVVGPSGGHDDTATNFYGAVAAGVLTITANAAATADTDVAFIIDGGN